ncbi:Rossmann fold domain-containing protein [Altererythrobacter aquiaggeris]|uniref:Rossmann fold domain-containing protein n=1 Tax=Aestuarierythrobacter aquiaggeris TaxID=1898396 RepID=UPI003016439E
MQAVFRIDSLPAEAVEAAALFYAEYVPMARKQLADATDALAIVLPGAPHDHTAWRRAAAQDLARAAAPVRVNILSGGDDAAMEASLAWLAQAPGITGQLLPLVAAD